LTKDILPEKRALHSELVEVLGDGERRFVLF